MTSRSCYSIAIRLEAFPADGGASDHVPLPASRIRRRDPRFVDTLLDDGRRAAGQESGNRRWSVKDLASECIRQITVHAQRPTTAWLAHRLDHCANGHGSHPLDALGVVVEYGQHDVVRPETICID